MKSALVTGISGQDGSFAAELLLKKGYAVTGVLRSLSKLGNSESFKNKVQLIEGDLRDRNFVDSLAQKQFTEIYNFASITSVASPWDDIVEVSTVAGLVPLYFLDAIRRVSSTTKLFQASSAEMFGAAVDNPQTESTRYMPRSPYGVAKLFAHQMVESYRKQYGCFAVSGILYNHESPRRSLDFVTRKITSTLARIANGSNEILEIGNVNAVRDWSYAADIVNAAWLSMQAPRPDTYIFSSGKSHSVRDFISLAASLLKLPLHWRGEEGKEYATSGGRIIVQTHPRYYRATEPFVRCGDSSKAEQILGWRRRVNFEGLVSLMVAADRLAIAKCEL